jgi:CBS domain-containing protein
MTRKPVALLPESSARDALELAQDCGFRHLPVVEPGGRLAGIVTVDDLRSRAALPRGSRVVDVMTRAPFTCTPDTPLEDAAEELARRRIGCLPVVGAGGELVGLLTETDALRALAALARQHPQRGRR